MPLILLYTDLDSGNDLPESSQKARPGAPDHNFTPNELNNAMCAYLPDYRFASLGSPSALWTVASIHGDLERLSSLHDAIAERFEPGQRLLYFGNYLGHSIEAAEVVDEVLAFRKRLTSLPGVKADDIVYLRGAQEDMWAKLLQLQFYARPLELLLWMLNNGLAHTLQAYGINPHDGIGAAREGVVALTRWTNGIRQVFAEYRGHGDFMRAQRRAASTGLPDGRFPLLFVNAGIDPARPLEKQDEALCWAGEHFGDMNAPYAPFEKVVRGYDPLRGGVYLNCVTATLDGGCGFGGNLVGACLRPDGEMVEILEA